MCYSIIQDLNCQPLLWYNQLMIFFYNILLFFSLSLSSPYILARLIITKRYRIGLRERLGYIPSKVLKSLAGRRPIWVQAVSVGELVAARPFLEALQENYSCPILLSTTTQAGHNIAKNSFLKFPFFFSLLIFL